MLYLIDSSVLQGAMFPNAKDMFNPGNSEAKSLLIIWCFIAGFSEKFVPNILSSTENRVLQSKKK